MVTGNGGVDGLRPWSDQLKAAVFAEDVFVSF